VALIPPFYLDTVVAVGLQNSDGEFFWIGSGFLFGKFIEIVDDKRSRYRTYLVTNKHVIKNQKKVFLRFNPKSNEKSRDYAVDLVNTNDQIIWTGHPDPNIDVAVLKLNANQLEKDGMKFNYFHSDTQIMTISQMNEGGITEGDFIYTLGFPMNLVDKDRKYVIVRSGIIARIRNLLDGFSNEFLIDSFVFPGNSGGPVIIKPEIQSIENTKPPQKANLIGMVQSYISYRDTAVSQQTNEPRIVFVENAGLARVIPIDFVLETINVANSNTEKP